MILKNPIENAYYKGFEIRIIPAIEKKELELHHDFEAVHEIGCLKEYHPQTLVAKCKKCGQILIGRLNISPKPLIFGRKNWKEVKLSGLPAEAYCDYLQRQNWALEQ